LAGYHTLFYIGLAAAILTGCYLTRAYCLTFTGPSHLEESAKKSVKEAPNVMLVPITILCFLAIVGGFLGFTFGKTPLLENFLMEIGLTRAEEELHSGFILTPETWVAVIGSFIGIGIFAWVYTRDVNRLGSTFSLLRKSFYVDEIYDNLIVFPLEALSRLIANVFEPKVFDGLIKGAVVATQGISRGMQVLQSGQIRSYIAWMVAGSVLLIAYFVF
jgi:NADH-quinone oxidoreductase subunit L